MRCQSNTFQLPFGHNAETPKLHQECGGLFAAVLRPLQEATLEPLLTGRLAAAKVETRVVLAHLYLLTPSIAAIDRTAPTT